VSKLYEKLSKGEFVVTTELTPPKGIDITDLLNKAESLKDCVDAFNLTDSHSSIMSLSPVAVATRLLDLGCEPILQMTTRDRNRLGLQSDMLGAALLGIENLVCMGGDPPHLGDHPDAKPVFDLATTELIRAAHSLTEGHDLMGNPLQGKPGFNIGAVVNPGVDDLDTEISRLQEKAEAGAWFFQTQAIYDPFTFLQFMDHIAHLPIRILAGIMPIKSVKMANFVNNKIPGINIPEDLIREIEQAKNVRTTSTEIAVRTINEIREKCAGVHIMAMGNEDQIPKILAQTTQPG
jgi:5,10-methylenetetrahydrofolate reductase|tara:strand:+ start:200 stop:1075 length:876 start_codon:yes stop_codon:yes gene_type:complete